MESVLNGNLFLVENFYSPEDLESQGYKPKVPT